MSARLEEQLTLSEIAKAVQLSPFHFLRLYKMVYQKSPMQYLAGRRLRAMLFWVPQRAEVGIGVSIISYDGSLRVGIIADSELVSEPDQLARAFETELEELQQAS